jgi:hypothetical protein
MKIMTNEKKVSLICFVIAVFFITVIASSWVTQHAIRGGDRLVPSFRRAVLSIAGLPGKIKSVVSLSGHLIPPKGNQYIYGELPPRLSPDFLSGGFLLIPFIDNVGENQVSIFNLANGHEKRFKIPQSSGIFSKYSDHLNGVESKRQEALSSRKRVWNPYLTDNGKLVFNIPWNDLVSVDLQTGNEEWRIRGAFHHSIEPDPNGDLWVCASTEPCAILNDKPKIQHANSNFEDSVAVCVSKNGKILKSISISDLLVRSGLEFLLYGVSNPNVVQDPIHLNQITPIHEDAGVFRRGQILISLRNISTILLLEPATEKVIWYGCGPWMNQHSVFPSGSSTFSVLDNHSFASGQFWINQDWNTRVLVKKIGVTQPDELKFISDIIKKFRIPVEGRTMLIAPETWMVEDSHQGTVMVFKDQQLVFKWSNFYPNGMVGFVSWSRFISKSPLLEDLLKQ